MAAFSVAPRCSMLFCVVGVTIVANIRIRFNLHAINERHSMFAHTHLHKLGERTHNYSPPQCTRAPLQREPLHQLYKLIEIRRFRQSQIMASITICI